MTHRSADRHELRNPGDATIIRLLARRAVAVPRDDTGHLETT